MEEQSQDPQPYPLREIQQQTDDSFLRENRDWYQFLLQLSDALRPIADPVAVEETATRLAMQYLDADRCYYCQVVDGMAIITRDARRDQLPSVAGTYPLNSFHLLKRVIDEGTPFIVNDAHTTPILDEELRAVCLQLQVISFLDVPIIKQGNAVGVLCLVQSTPRIWTEPEIQLQIETAERTWAAVERARAEDALTKSEERLQLATNAAQIGTFVYYPKEDRGEPDAQMLALYGLPPDNTLNLAKALTQIIYPDDRQRYANDVTQALNPAGGGKLDSDIRIVHPDGSVHWMNVRGQVIFDNGQAVRMPGVSTDITERKRREEQQAFLLTFSDVLRTLGDQKTIEETGLQLLAEFLGLDRAYVFVLYPAQDRAVVRSEQRNQHLPSIVGEVRMSDFPETVRQIEDQTIVFQDIDSDTRLSDLNRTSLHAVNLQAFVCASIRKGERNVIWSIAAVSATPRTWTKTEIELIEIVAERIWAAVERAKAEEALRESQKRFESIANLMPDLLWDSRPDGFSSWCNQRWLDYTGQRLEEAIGWGWTLAIHPDDRDASARRYGEAVATGQSLRQEHRIRRHDGTYRWFVVSAAPLKDQTGQVIKMYGAATDIHDRKLAEAALQESEKRLRLAIEATELATWEWNLKTNQVYWNEQHFRLFGMEPRPNPLSPDEFMRHVHPHEQARISQLLERTIAERGVYEAEFCAVREDGSQRWLSGYGRITEERDGQPVRLSGVMFDVDERRRAEDVLRLADRRKDEFLAMLAHELRNPLSTVRSGLQILTITDGKDQTSSDTIAMMNRQTDQLVRLVDDLLDVSRISQGKIELKKQPLNLVEVVAQAAESSQGLYQEQNRRLQVELPTTPIEVEGDAVRLSQVVTNLLTNGVRYSRENGQVWLSLSHQAGPSGGYEAVLQVRDNGIGLAADQLEAIFELFVQADTSLARSKGGLGVGLTLVKRLVELHGGRVTARSEGVGKGSTFYVHLPTVNTAPEGSPEAADESSPAPTAPHRILVVDDNADAALTLSTLLKLKGYEVHTRHSGQAGLAAGEELRPGAILLDIGMPGLDGYETCQLIRQQPWGASVVVIALTGYGQEEDRQRTREAGFDEHLVKPVDLAALTKLLRDLLDQPEQLMG